MMNLLLALGSISVVLAAIQFYGYFNWYEKKPAGKGSAHLEKGVLHLVAGSEGPARARNII